MFNNKILGAAVRARPQLRGSLPWWPQPAAPETASITASCVAVKWWANNIRPIQPLCYPLKPRSFTADNNPTCCKIMLRSISRRPFSRHYSHSSSRQPIVHPLHNPPAIVHPRPHPAQKNLLKGKIPGMARPQLIISNIFSILWRHGFEGWRHRILNG